MFSDMGEEQAIRDRAIEMNQGKLIDMCWKVFSRHEGLLGKYENLKQVFSTRSEENEHAKATVKVLNERLVVSEKLRHREIQEREEKILTLETKLRETTEHYNILYDSVKKKEKKVKKK